MIFSDLHMHSIFCDGKNTPEEMVLSAIDKGLKRVGVVVHSYTEFDQKYSVSLEGAVEFKKEMARLKEKYKDKIEVLCGVEQDYFSSASTEGYDYVIGSVHYFKVCEEYYHVDMSEEYLTDVVNSFFDGDFYAAAEYYFDLVSKIYEKTNCDIIGHFDLISKFNEGEKLFNESHPRYLKAYTAALESLLKYKKPFEINFGAISRGYRSTPYPSKTIRGIIEKKGGVFLLSSDAHNIDNIAYCYKEWEEGKF